MLYNKHFQGLVRFSQVGSFNVTATAEIDGQRYNAFITTVVNPTVLHKRTVATAYMDTLKRQEKLDRAARRSEAKRNQPKI